MRIFAVVQARFDSRRLPGKALLPLAGQPMLGRVFDALAQARAIDGLALATSSLASDDPLAEFARARGVACHRGPLDDVARRMLDAARALGADVIVRVSGDSPLIDPALVDRAARSLRAAPAADLVSNVHPRSFPKGQSVEAIRVAALDRAVRAMTRADEREHVTPHFYAHPENYRIVSFGAETPRPELQLSVDTPEDLARCAAILARLAAPAWREGWRACVAAADALEGAVR
jgi:spore coat polysaccharide biosynthesis protein SpsF